MAIVADTLSSSGFSGGSPSALYAAQAAYASLPSAALYPAGTLARVTNVGVNGSVWVSNGSEWTPESPITIYTSTDSYARAPTGTIGTGASGNITFGTAANRAYTEGLYVYLPNIATTPAITAGYYWCVMSSTTVGTLYESKGGAAINFSAGAAYTGVTTQIDSPPETLIGGVLGNYRRLSITGIISTTNDANSKSAGINFAGTIRSNNTFTNNLTWPFLCNIFSKSSSVQIFTPSMASGGGAGASTTAYATVDMTVNQTFSVALATGSTATDWFVVDSWQAVLFPR
jgi:hypothetical protein